MFDDIYTLALASTEKDVLALGEYLIENLNPPAGDRAYAGAAAAAVMIAVRNEGSRAVPDEKVREALLRARRQAVPSLCGVTVCGIAAAVTTSFRLLLGTACPRSRAAVNTAIYNRVAGAISAAGREPDCKRFLRAALAEVPALAGEYLKINVPAHGSRPDGIS